MKPYIPQPCHEDWNAMSEKDKGRHCDVCAKVVVDFTKMSDAEMIDYLQQHSNQKTCGHFRNDQLYQTEKLKINLATIPTNLSFRKYFVIALLIAFTSFGLISCKSNSGKTVGEIEVVDSTQTTKQDSSTSLTGAVAPLPPKEFTEGEICIQPSDSGKSKKTQKTTTMTTPSTVVGIIEEPDDKLILPPPPPHTKPKITYVEPNTLRGDTIIINKEDITKHKTMGKPILPSKQK